MQGSFSIDGVSLLPLANGGTSPPRHPHGWRLTTYPRAGEVELYHLTTVEEHNLGRDPDYDAIQAALAARLTTPKVCSGAGCRR